MGSGGSILGVIGLVGFVTRWLTFGTLIGGSLSACCSLLLFGIGWVADEYMYGG